MSRLGLLGLLTACLLIYHLHIPLPEKFGDRTKMQIFDFVMRLVYFYPMKSLSYLGHDWQLMWTRGTLGFFSRVLGPWSLRDPELEIVDTTMDGVRARVYVPKGPRSSDAALIFIHGGGFVLLDVDAYESVTRELARKARVVTVSIDYRLAPEHVFPAGIDDCERAVAAFLREANGRWGVDPERVAIAGDSAGGNLAAVTTHRLRNRTELPQLKLQLLIYPVVQFADLLTPSYQLYYQQYPGTSLLDPESIARWLMMYLGVEPLQERVELVMRNGHVSPTARARPQFAHLRHDRLPDHFKNHSTYHHSEFYEEHQLYELLEPFLFNPEFSPLMQRDLSGLPKALVVTCQYDILRDEGFLYAERLRDDGTDVTWKHYDDGFHAALNFHTEMEVGRNILKDLVSYVHEHL